MFPDAVRAKCLIVLVRGNPYFMKSFTPEDHNNMDTLFRLGKDALERQGYQVVSMGKHYTEDDFMDAGHFMASGGRKLAREVADHILQQAKKPQ